MKKWLIGLLILGLLVAGLAGCGTKQNAARTEKKVFKYGTTAYGPEMSDAGLNPHENYSGWSAVRYGVGETLFRFNEKMELEPWLATGYKQLDDYTVEVTLRDNVTFSSGRKLDGAAVKECLEDLIAKHDRAPGDLQLKSITANGNKVTLVSKQKVPALLNYLSDPYGAIIDMQAGVTRDKNVSGTGPFIAKVVADHALTLVKNEKYWGGPAKVDEVQVKTITDGDTLAMALQSGDIDAAQGLPYASLALFQDNKDYQLSGVDTSRTFYASFNFATPVLQDVRVRRAVAMGIDKENFAKVLLKGNGTAAVGPFPANFTFGDQQVQGPKFDLEGAKKLLAAAGWRDTDGDGYVDKDGQKLTLRWLTYPGRMELPLLAEAAQASLKKIGIELRVNSTANHKDFLKQGDWDIYAMAFVTAPTGDPAYFFTTNSLSKAAKNSGKYTNSQLDALGAQLAGTFAKEERSALAIKMTQILLDDCANIFAAHLHMNFVMKKKVSGFVAHPSDYYELTNKLELQ